MYILLHAMYTLSLGSNNFLSFFNDKITSIRDRCIILCTLSRYQFILSNTGTLEVAAIPDVYVDRFSLTDLQQLTNNFITETIHLSPSSYPN